MDLLRRTGADPGVGLGARPALTYTGDRRMETVVESFLLPLAVAAISGAGFMAYRHPDAYFKVAGPISLLAAAVFVFGIGYQFALLNVEPALMSSVGYRDSAAISQALKDEGIPLWAAAVLFAVLLAQLALGHVAQYMQKQRGIDHESAGKADESE